MPTALSAQTTISEAEAAPEIVKVFCKRCGASAKPFSRYCETCGNTLDLSKEKPATEPAASESEKTEKTVITGKLVVPPAAAAFRTQADSTTGRLQASLSERAQRPASVESSSDSAKLAAESAKFAEQAERAAIISSGRKTTAIQDSLTTNFPEVNIGRSTNPGLDLVGTSFSNKEDEIPSASEQSIQQSDSRGAKVVWVIILTLAVLAGLVAKRLYNVEKNRSLSAKTALPDPAQSTNAILGATPEAPSPTPSVNAPAGMVFVPGGTFRMGRNNGDEFESPEHEVYVKPFFIDKTEVTNEEYQRFVSATGRAAPSHWTDGKIPEGEAKFPVVNVSWNDANEYAKWISKRLPTEAEWEFAARGTDGRIYPWGSGWKQNNANAGKGRKGVLGEIGRYAAGASPFGALDLCGNVWEWTSSEFVDYPDRKVASSLANAGLKVIRGGAYDVPPKRATSTYRGAVPPDRVFDKTGFRCVRDAQ